MARIGFVLLCGGKSSRMKQCKALLDIGGRTMLSAVAAAGEGFAERIISVNDPQIPTPQGYMRCADIHPDNGPMSGLHAALTMTACDALVTAPCDAPFYSRELAAYLAEQYTEEMDALILTDSQGRAHPLMGVYSRRMAAAFEQSMLSGHCKLMRLLDGMHTVRISLPQHIDERVLSNVNTPQEYAQLRAAGLS